MQKDDMFRLAEEQYTLLRNIYTFIIPPDYCSFPIDLPKCKAAFVKVNAGKIKEIEVHYKNGAVQTIRPEKKVNSE